MNITGPGEANFTRIAVIRRMGDVTIIPIMARKISEILFKDLVQVIIQWYISYVNNRNIINHIDIRFCREVPVKIRHNLSFNTIFFQCIYNIFD